MLTPEQMESVGRESDEAFTAFEVALLCAAAYALIRSRGDVGSVASLRARLNEVSARHAETLASAVRNDYGAAYAASFAEDAASAGGGVRVAVSFSPGEPDAATAARQAAANAAIESARAFGVAEIQRGMVEHTAQDYVRRVAANAAELAKSGTVWNDAIGEAVSAMAGEGVTAFEYARKDGVTVRVPTDVYVRQRVRTEVNAKCVEQTLKTAKSVGLLVEVTTHAGCRPSHAPWEGGLYQLEGEGPHRNFYRATMYVGGPYADWVEGLGGYNCYHQSRCCQGPHDRRFGKDPLEGTGYTNEQAYALRGRQRAMENDIRKLKRQKEVLEANGLDAHAVNVRLNAKRAELRAHVEKHQKILRRDSQRWREQLPGAPRTTDREYVGRIERDTIVGRNLSAAAYRDKVIIPKKLTGLSKDIETRVSAGARIYGKAAIAGKGTNVPIHSELDSLKEQFPDIPRSEWTKMAGNTNVDDMGLSRKAHVHWYECEDMTRKQRMKVVKWLR